MAIYRFRFTNISNTELTLNAKGASSSSASVPRPILGDVPQPTTSQCDQNLQVQVKHEPEGAFVYITDASMNNTAGPNVMTLNGSWNPVVLGHAPPAPMSPWSLWAAGEASAGLLSLPVILSQLTAGVTRYLHFAAYQASGSATTTATVEFDATVMNMTPLTPPDPAWLDLPVTAPPGMVPPTPIPPGLTVGAALTTLWNKLFALLPAPPNTSWAQTLAPTLVAWIYDYPSVNPVENWAADFYRDVYATIYAPYVVQDPPESGWGTGTPPTAQPPGVR